MFISIAILLAVAQAAPPTNVDESSVALWRGLHIGMSPDAVVTTLKMVEGVKDVQVVRKGKKPPFVKIDYVTNGIDIAGKSFVIEVSFVDEKLSEVDLRNSSCSSVASAFLGDIVNPLKEKYGHAGREKVVDENGVTVDYRLAFWNSDTRVRISFFKSTPGLVEYSTRGRGGALSSLMDAMAESAARSARANCPNDALGARTLTNINYSSQSQFEQDVQRLASERDGKAAAVKDGL